MVFRNVEELKMPDSNDDRSVTTGKWLAIGIGTGVAIGVAIGAGIGAALQGKNSSERR